MAQLVILIALIITILIIMFVKQDFKSQEETIEGKKYRRIHGAFNIDQYFGNDKLIKDSDWAKQKNNGPNPQKRKQFGYKQCLGAKMVCIVDEKGL